VPELRKLRAYVADGDVTVHQLSHRCETWDCKTKPVEPAAHCLIADLPIDRLQTAWA